FAESSHFTFGGYPSARKHFSTEHRSSLHRLPVVESRLLSGHIGGSKHPPERQLGHNIAFENSVQQSILHALCQIGIKERRLRRRQCQLAEETAIPWLRRPFEQPETELERFVLVAKSLRTVEVRDAGLA